MTTTPSMPYDEVLAALGKEFGVLAESDTRQLTVVAHNSDVAVGDLFLLPSRRGGLERFYLFRASEYANVLNRSIEIGDVARNKLTMPDSYRSEDLIEEQLLEMKGVVLGYAERVADAWSFRRPRRLPEHLTNVYRVDPDSAGAAAAIKALLGPQLGEGGLFIGELLAGERPLKGVRVYLPAYALSHHLGAFGRTGVGKSNLMMVLLRSVFEYNRARMEGVQSGPPASIFAVDPHDEFNLWHKALGGASGVRGIVESLPPEQRGQLVDPFYYLTAKRVGRAGREREMYLSNADVLPQDIVSITELSEQMVSFVNYQFAHLGEEWIARILNNQHDTGIEFAEATLGAVQRRLGFLATGQSAVFGVFWPDQGEQYASLLPDIVCALERGRVLVVDTTLMTEMEQFLLTTVVARTLFTLRRAFRSIETPEELEAAIHRAFDNEQNEDGTELSAGQRTLVAALLERLASGELPYRVGGKLAVLPGGVPSPGTNHLPFVNVVVEEAPSILNPARMRFGSVFRDISRQGRKFGIGLTVVSQQVSEIDQGVLTQINTELTMGLGNEHERREAVKNASADLAGFEKELQVMGKGQVIVTASYRDMPLPVQVPHFDDNGEA